MIAFVLVFVDLFRSVRRVASEPQLQAAILDGAHRLSVRLGHRAGSPERGLVERDGHADIAREVGR